MISSHTVAGNASSKWITVFSPLPGLKVDGVAFALFKTPALGVYTAARSDGSSGFREVASGVTDPPMGLDKV